MTKEFALDLIKLLSALESWAFAEKKTLPDYLHQNIADALDAMTVEVLK